MTNPHGRGRYNHTRLYLVILEIYGVQPTFKASFDSRCATATRDLRNIHVRCGCNIQRDVGVTSGPWSICILRYMSCSSRSGCQEFWSLGLSSLLVARDVFSSCDAEWNEWERCPMQMRTGECFTITVPRPGAV